MPADRLSAGYTCIFMAAVSAIAGCTTAPEAQEDLVDSTPTAEQSASIAPLVSQSTSLLSVPLDVRNELNIDRKNEYVTSGVPIPLSWNALTPAQMNIVDNAGAAVPSQFVVTARWGGLPSDTTRPIKWVLATFQATISASGTGTYSLLYGAPNATATSLKVASDTTSAITISTGAATFVVNKARFSLFDSVTVNGVVTTSSNQNGFVLTDASGNTYTSANGTPSSVTVDESGPVRVVVRVDGSLKRSDGLALTDYTSWLYFYAGQSYVRVVHTIGNHNKANVNTSGNGYDVFNYNGQNSITFKGLEAVVDLYQPSGSYSYLMPTDAGNKSGTFSSLNVYQDSSGNDYWNRYASSANAPRLNANVKSRGFKATSGGSQIATGNHFAGWMDVSDSSKGVTLGMLGFWQNFPKGLSSTGTRIQANIFPKDFASTYNFRVGEEKTTELFMFFHNGTATAAGADKVAQGLASPMMAIAEPAWYSESGAVQEFTAPADTLEDRLGDYGTTDDAARYEYYNDRTLSADPSWTSTYYQNSHSLWLSSAGHPSSTDYYDFYGWSWYGNQPMEQEATADGQSGPFDVKYNFDYGAWIQFLRTGDYRWKGMAEAYTKHLESIMLHNVVTSTGWDIGRWKNAIFGHSEHNESGNPNSVRNYLGPVADTAFGAKGAALHWFLTGYPVSKRFVTDAADYAYAAYGSYTWASSPGWAPSREAGNVLNILNAGWEVTGNRTYQGAVSKILNEFLASKQAWINGPVAGASGQLPTWIFGLYYCGIARYAALAGEYGLTSEVSLAKAQLSAYLKWHLTYATIAPSGWLATFYQWQINGNNSSSDTSMVNNWMLLLSDSFAYGYALTGDSSFLTAAQRLFHTGVQNPFFLGSPLVYSSSKEAVNSAVFGHAYMYYGGLEKSVPPASDIVAPVVVITAPSAGATLSGTVNFQVTATDNVGVQKVEYYVNGQLAGTATSSPWSLSFDTKSKTNGQYSLAAYAYDAKANKGGSSSLNFIIQNTTTTTDTAAPSCSVTSPASSTTVSGTVTVAAAASDNVAVKSVQFYVDGAAYGSPVTVAPFTVSLDTTKHTNGSCTLQAKATDSSGNVGSSPSVAVTVSNSSSQASGTVSISGGSCVKDALYRATYDGNYGKSAELTTYNGASVDYRSALYFDLSCAKLPANATVTSVKMNLYSQMSTNVVDQVYRYTRSWTEGSGLWGNSKNGITWTTSDGSTRWTTPGGDVDTSSDYGNGKTGVVAQMAVGSGVQSFDITSLGKQWIAGTVPNYGVMMTIPSTMTYAQTKFSSTQDTTAARRPTLVITYTTP